MKTNHLVSEAKFKKSIMKIKENSECIILCEHCAQSLTSFTLTDDTSHLFRVGSVYRTKEFSDVVYEIRVRSMREKLFTWFDKYKER